MKPTQLLLNGNIYANLLQGQLAFRVVHFFYAKNSNGQLREAWGTTSKTIIQCMDPGYTPSTHSAKQNPSVIKYYDLQRQGWRCLSAANFYGYVVNYWEDSMPDDIKQKVPYIESMDLLRDDEGILQRLVKERAEAYYTRINDKGEPELELN